VIGMLPSGDKIAKLQPMGDRVLIKVCSRGAHHCKVDDWVQKQRGRHCTVADWAHEQRGRGVTGG
jgi:hypothetical protein